MPLGYGYGWYIYGSYSPDLTAIAYQIIPEGFDSVKGHTFKETYAKIVTQVNKHEEEITKHRLTINNVKWYELLASIAYWYKRGNDNQHSIIKKINETKPQFTKIYIILAYDTYVEFKKSVSEGD